MKTERSYPWLPVVLALLLALLIMLLISPTAVQHPAAAAAPGLMSPQQAHTFTGHVYEGVPPDTTPLQNVTVILYGSNNAGEWGAQLASAVTDNTGAYLLSTEQQGIEYFHIVEIDPSGYNSTVAQAGVGGAAINSNWIRFENPNAGSYGDNNFWDRRPPTETPQPTPSPSPTHVPKSTYTPTSTPATPPPTPTETPQPTPSPSPTHVPQSTYTPTATPAIPPPTPTESPVDEADLRIRKRVESPAQGPVAPGSQIRYALEVTNLGPNTAQNVIIEDSLPPGFTFDSASPGCTLTTSAPPNDIVRCELGDMPPSPPTQTVWVQANVGEQVCGRVGNEATVSSDTADSFSWNNTDFAETLIAPCNQPAVLIEKTQVDPPEFQTRPGDIVTYRLVITNIGDTPLDRVALIDTFDSKPLAYVDASKMPNRILTGPEEGSITWLDLTLPPPLGFDRPLAPGASFVLNARFQTIKQGSANNCAEVNAAAGDVLVEDNACSYTYINDDAQGFSLEKRLTVPSDGPAAIGQTVMFMITLRNRSDQTIVGLRLRDQYDETLLTFRNSAYNPDDPANDGVLDWADLTQSSPHGFGAPLEPGNGRGFSVSFRAAAATPPGQPSQNCVRAWYWYEDQVEIEVPPVCASIVIANPQQPAISLEKRVLLPPDGLALPGDPVHFRFKVANTGGSTLTKITLDDLYDSACLSFTPFGSASQNPDDLNDDGSLHWEQWLGINSLPPGWSIEAMPGVQFRAKAGRACDPTENRLEATATDENGATVQAQAKSEVFISSDPFALFDLGDAPASANHAGAAMTAYPGVQANFPTVFDSGIGAFGPAHKQPRVGPWLGRWVSGEANADLGPDEDGVLNIFPGADIPNRDRDDDGLHRPLVLKHCQPTDFEFTVTYPPGVPRTEYYLNAWFDWDRDGKWGAELECGDQTASEWAVRNRTLPWQPPGTYTFRTQLFLSWNQEGDAPLWMRVTLGGQPSDWADGRGPVNGYEYGETEDYVVHDGGYILYLPLILRADEAL